MSVFFIFLLSLLVHANAGLVRFNAGQYQALNQLITTFGADSYLKFNASSCETSQTMLTTSRVLCNAAGAITHIHLASVALSNNIPYVFDVMTSLVYLNLSDNLIGGDAGAIMQATRLTALDISHNSIISNAVALTQPMTQLTSCRVQVPAKYDTNCFLNSMLPATHPCCIENVAGARPCPRLSQTTTAGATIVATTASTVAPTVEQTPPPTSPPTDAPTETTTEESTTESAPAGVSSTEATSVTLSALPTQQQQPTTQVPLATTTPQPAPVSQVDGIVTEVGGIVSSRTSADRSTVTTVIAIVVPIVAICLILFAVILFIRKRRDNEYHKSFTIGHRPNPILMPDEGSIDHSLVLYDEHGNARQDGMRTDDASFGITSSDAERIQQQSTNLPPPPLDVPPGATINNLARVPSDRLPPPLTTALPPPPTNSIPNPNGVGNYHQLPIKSPTVKARNPLNRASKDYTDLTFPAANESSARRRKNNTNKRKDGNTTQSMGTEESSTTYTKVPTSPVQGSSYDVVPAVRKPSDEDYDAVVMKNKEDYSSVVKGVPGQERRYAHLLQKVSSSSTVYSPAENYDDVTSILN